MSMANRRTREVQRTGELPDTIDVENEKSGLQIVPQGSPSGKTSNPRPLSELTPEVGAKLTNQQLSSSSSSPESSPSTSRHQSNTRKRKRTVPKRSLRYELVKFPRYEKCKEEGCEREAQDPCFGYCHDCVVNHLSDDDKYSLHGDDSAPEAGSNGN